MFVVSNEAALTDDVMGTILAGGLAAISIVALVCSLTMQVPVMDVGTPDESKPPEKTATTLEELARQFR